MKKVTRYNVNVALTGVPSYFAAETPADAIATYLDENIFRRVSGYGSRRMAATCAAASLDIMVELHKFQQDPTYPNPYIVPFDVFVTHDGKEHASVADAKLYCTEQANLVTDRWLHDSEVVE